MMLKKTLLTVFGCLCMTLAQTAAAENESALLKEMTNEAQSIESSVKEKASRNLAELRADLKREKSERIRLVAEKRRLERSIADLKKEMALVNIRYVKVAAAAKETSASRMTLVGAMKLTATSALERAGYSPVAAAHGLDTALLGKVITNTQFPSLDDVRGLIGYLFAETEHCADVVVKTLPVTLPDGEIEETEVTVAGGLSAIAEVNGEVKPLTPSANAGSLRPVAGNLEEESEEVYEDWTDGDTVLLPVDLTKGDIYSRLEPDRSLFTHLNAGGALVWIILLIGAAAGVLGGRELFELTQLRNCDGGRLETALSRIDRGDFRGAAAVMGADSPAAVPSSVIRSMLDTDSPSVLTFEKRLDEAIERFVTPLEKGISAVAVAAAVAPLLGLLGTVTGMISTFDVITLFGNGDPKLLSGGISVALITTEVGLVVSIVLMVLHYFLTQRLEAVSQSVEEAATQTLARASARLVKSPLEGVSDDSIL